MRTIGVVTVARSDYGIYRPLLRELRRRDAVDVRLYVGGAHFSERFGHTVGEIEADGFPIVERLEFLLPDDSPLAVARSAGRGVEAFATAFARTPSELLVVLGDRLEMLAAGLAALPLRIPVAHLHGGESTEGAIDDSMRHALTKLSHLHFASTEEYARRIRQLGEEPWRVTVTGAPALDAIREHVPVDDSELAARGVRLRGDTLLVTFHPVTLEPEATAAHLGAVLGAVADSGLDAILTYPNADAAHTEIIERLESFARSDVERFTVVRNLGTDAYFTLLRRAVAMVGNSSSGIIEAASFELPVVDVGARQQGRVRGQNVLHSEPERAAVAATIARAVSQPFRESLRGIANPYGDGRASERIANVLVSIPLDERVLTKRFHDV